MCGQLFKARKLIPYFTILELGVASFEVEQILDVIQSGVSRLRFKGCQLYVIQGITLAGLEAMLLSHQCPTFVSALKSLGIFRNQSSGVDKIKDSHASFGQHFEISSPDIYQFEGDLIRRT